MAGNIRELQDVVERAVILSKNGALMNPLPAVATSPVSAPNAFHATLRDSERALILQALKEVGWVIGGPAGAAAKLGLKMRLSANPRTVCATGDPAPHPWRLRAAGSRE